MKLQVELVNENHGFPKKIIRFIIILTLYYLLNAHFKNPLALVFELIP